MRRVVLYYIKKQVHRTSFKARNRLCFFRFHHDPRLPGKQRPTSADPLLLHKSRIFLRFTLLDSCVPLDSFATSSYLRPRFRLWVTTRSHVTKVGFRLYEERVWMVLKKKKYGLKGWTGLNRDADKWAFMTRRLNFALHKSREILYHPSTVQEQPVKLS